MHPLEQRDKAEALRVYAKQRGNVEMECWVAEIKVRASRRIGELSAALQDGRESNSAVTKAATLRAAGLSKMSASRCERIASLNEGEFEAHIAKAAMDGRAITAEEVLKAVAKLAKRERIAEAAPMRHWCQVEARATISMLQTALDRSSVRIRELESQRATAQIDAGDAQFQGMLPTHVAGR